jgi:hypothetical protein
VISVSNLIAAGLVKSGTRLTWKRRGGDNFSAEIQSNGFIKTSDGAVHKSPSGAAKKLISRPVDGWNVWRVPSGFTLADLRKQLPRS